MDKEIGLVLSGGGVKGVSHLGLIKALEESDVKIKMMSGTSAGAIVCAFYAYGYSTDDILEIVRSLKKIKFLRPAMSLTGILKMETLYKVLLPYFPNNSFSALKIPISIAATNLRTGRTEYFQEGDLVGAICASSCIPVLFNPFAYRGELYIDGGILNNLPVEPIVGKTGTILGSHCNPIDNNFKPKNARSVMERALNLALTTNSYSSKSHCDFFFEPAGLETYKVMDFSYAQKIYDIGYAEARKHITQFGLSD